MRRLRTKLHTSIRWKVIAILSATAGIPFLIGMVLVQVMGYQAYEREKGTLYQAIAEYAADSLNQIIDLRVNAFSGWVTHSRLAQVTMVLLSRVDPHPAPPTAEEIANWETHWRSLPEDDPELAPFLTNEVTYVLRSFQRRQPLFVEFLVTDSDGRLVAATNKTSDYWQGDEEWWQSAKGLAPDRAWTEGIEYDESAGVYSLDIAIPIADPTRPQQVIGVIKAVLNASPLIESIHPVFSDERPVGRVILADGRILARLFERGRPPLVESIGAEAAEQICRRGAGWMVSRLTTPQTHLVGFAGILETRPYSERIVVAGLAPMYVTVHKERSAVLAPVINQLKILGLCGVLLVLGFGAYGLVLSRRKIIAPLQLLREASRSISATARLKASDREKDDVHTERQVREMVDRLAEIGTGDEIEGLAEEFRLMGDRVLNYHRQLESEIETKTEEIQRDLTIAREFQEALLPRSYPEVPAPGHSDPVALRFAHRYRPALSVGGDFFRVSRISDHRACVFIADVMGHGARAALITAIMRTVLVNIERTVADPAELLNRMNRQFCEIVPQEREFIYATGLGLILDTEHCTVSATSAGHQAPLRLRHGEGQVEPLLSLDQACPAIGLDMDTQYTSFQCDIAPGDMFLLYTDGIIEAPDAGEDRFGEARLAALLQQCNQEDAEGLTENVIQTVSRFMGTVISPDDLCVVAAEVLPGAIGS